MDGGTVYVSSVRRKIMKVFKMRRIIQTYVLKKTWYLLEFKLNL